MERMIACWNAQVRCNMVERAGSQSLKLKSDVNSRPGRRRDRAVYGITREGSG